MMFNLDILGDVSAFPSRFKIGGPPFLIMVIGIILWSINFNRRRYGEPNIIVSILSYVVIFGAGVFSYIYNRDYFDPALLNAPNYWNNQAKVALYLSVFFPPILTICVVLIDYLKTKQIQRENDLE